MPNIRLDKYLANMGVGSRTAVKELIRKKQVTVNEVTAVSPEQKVDTERDRIFCQGEPIGFTEFEYLMLHKPAGVVSAVTLSLIHIFQLDLEQVLAEGLYIDEYYVGGMTIAEARDVLQKAYEEAGQTAATVYWQTNPVKTNLADLGLYWSIDDALSRCV